MGIVDRDLLHNLVIMQLATDGPDVYVYPGLSLTEAIYMEPQRTISMVQILNILNSLNHNCVHFTSSQEGSIQTIHWCENVICTTL